MAMTIKQEDSPVRPKQNKTFATSFQIKSVFENFFLFLKELLEFLLRIYPAVMAELEGNSRSHAFDG